ncbi:Aerobic-type carbon monoxide dehydrogenase, small subunit CoxS/CutS-like protein [Paraburkholderia ribeironis]|uniref:Aerobic-type carbon monoxide dehydrogenase, small subunit CoxS/CutS-like protein n=1 Tax=Paraburkholderia ribeironis TaxID=1247936 RepID=A0A1N7RIM8_9BURK|nr:Aerobic-type carbon monoxide dehydrogenase, small subunit CoxS/CutS-like protein [Paraburkholderia ribeironis]
MSTHNECQPPCDEAASPQQPSRRRFLQSAAAAATIGAAPHLRAQTQTPAAPPAPTREPVPPRPVTLTINGRAYTLQLEPRVTLLDALREYAGLMGTKKGCDRGQCGACTVLADGRRINACLTLAVMHEGENITTVEGLATPAALSPLQRAFIGHDAFQCGYCTPGQLCSATALLTEFRNGTASTVTADVRSRPAQLSDDEIRERMSGNICRCGAYGNIVAAIRAVHDGGVQTGARSSVHDGGTGGVGIGGNGNSGGNGSGNSGGNSGGSGDSSNRNATLGHA